MGKGLENMQAAVETDAKGKAKSLRMKKKLRKMSWISNATWSTLTMPTPRPRGTSRPTGLV